MIGWCASGLPEGGGGVIRLLQDDLGPVGILSHCLFTSCAIAPGTNTALETLCPLPLPQFARKMMNIQTLQASQKQPTIFQIKKWILLEETDKETLPWYKNISPGFKKSKEAIKGTCVDKNPRPSLTTSPSEVRSCLV